MFKMLKMCRKKPELLSYFSTTMAVRCDRSENKTDQNLIRKKSTEKKEKKKPEKFFDKNTYASHSEEEKIKAKKKLRDLITKMQDKPQDQNELSNKIPVIQPKKRAATKKKLGTNDASFQKNLMNEVKKVAGHLGGDVAKTESDLLECIKSFNSSTKGSKSSPVKKISEVPTTKISSDKEVSEKVSSILMTITKIDQTKQKSSAVNFSEELGIFTQHSQHSHEEIHLKIWDDLEKEDLKFVSSSPPRNYFEELIMWTDQGKLWHFPIDNDQGMDEEAKVDFSEHVFLDEYLEGWCPSKGPLRHFMELVLVGLSKNPYLSVQDKKEHIYWFRDYFENKKKLLMEVGAIEKESNKSKENILSSN